MIKIEHASGILKRKKAEKRRKKREKSWEKWTA
jgi:hypothetical protein